MVVGLGKGSGLVSHLKRLHHDERGIEGVEWVLIIAAIALPLMGLLWWFAGDIKDWVVGIWEDARGKVDSDRDSFFNPN